MSKFNEFISEPESDDFIASACSVSVDSDGYFIQIETDAFEGSAHMTLPVASRVHEALGRAIEFARQQRVKGKKLAGGGHPRLRGGTSKKTQQ